MVIKPLAFSSFLSGLATLISFLFYLLVFSFLPGEDAGRFFSFFALLAILSFPFVVFSQPLLFLFQKKKDEKYISSSFFLSTLFSFFISFIPAFLSNNYSVSFLEAFLFAFFYFLNPFFYVLLNAKKRFYFGSVYQFSISLIRFLALLFLPHTLEMVFVANILGYSLPIISLVPFGFREVPFSFPSITYVKEIIKTGLPFLAQQIGRAMIFSTDVAVAPYLLPSNAKYVVIASYALMQRLRRGVGNLFLPFPFVMVPSFTSGERTLNLEKLSKILLPLFPLGLFISFLVVSLFFRNYLSGTSYLPFMFLALSIEPLILYLSSLRISEGKFEIVGRYTLIAGAFNFLLDIPAILLFGMFGALIVSVFSLLFLVFSLAQREERKEIVKHFLFASFCLLPFFFHPFLSLITFFFTLFISWRYLSSLLKILLFPPYRNI